MKRTLIALAALGACAPVLAGGPAAILLLAPRSNPPARAPAPAKAAPPAEHAPHVAPVIIPPRPATPACSDDRRQRKEC